ncbi:MAG: GntR family transcriptional regulator [Verrucomicrobia bacterium]|nr:GntR family transcriptional regulator [Verrucomicrobiota bacterium]
MGSTSAQRTTGRLPPRDQGIRLLPIFSQNASVAIPHAWKRSTGEPKVPFLLVRRIRETILDERFLPGDRLVEVDLAEKFKVSRSPVREALLALEKEGTVVMSPYKDAMVMPLSVAEARDIAELRLALISLALKPAHRHLSPADFDDAYDLAKRLTRTKNAKDHFETNRRFWDIIFSKAPRPILREVFRQLEDRGTRYEPVLLKLFPPETRPRQREVLIELYRKGKADEAFRAFKKIYSELVHEIIDHLHGHEADEPTH